MKILRAIFTQQQPGEASSAVMGVCSYIANRFHLDVLAVRIAMIGCAYFLNTSKVILAYIVVGSVLSVSGEHYSRKERKTKKNKKTASKKNTLSNTKCNNKDDNSKKIDTPEKPTPELSRVSVQQLERKLTRLENRLARLETGVTSNHLQMAREFNKLKPQQAEVASS